MKVMVVKTVWDLPLGPEGLKYFSDEHFRGLLHARNISKTRRCDLCDLFFFFSSKATLQASFADARCLYGFNLLKLL